MTARACLTPNCDRAPRPEWNYCPACAKRVIDNALSVPLPPRLPEWVRRMQAGRGVVKDYTRS